MGNINACAKCRRRNSTKDISVLLVGLDGAGKTQTAGLLAGAPADTGAPTIGFHPVRLFYRRRGIHLYDVGGCSQFRSAWIHYYPDAHGVIFVVDSADPSRLPECSFVLESVLSHPYISGKPILILANKQDIEGAMDDLDIVDKLQIEKIVNRYKCPTRVESYTATIKKHKRFIDPGLKKGYEWLLNYIIHHYDQINIRIQTDVMKESELNKELKTDSGIQSDSTELYESGFENPNYKMEPSDENGIIMVQQMYPPEDEKSVKLSPLFGTKSLESSNRNPAIELEARTQMRKLSPIVRKKAFVASQSFDDSKSDSATSTASANAIFAQQLKEFKSRETSPINEDEPRSFSPPPKNDDSIAVLPVLSDELPIRYPISKEGHKTILPPIKMENADSAQGALAWFHRTINEDIERPKSASEMVKRQLMTTSAPSHSRFFLKGMRSNKTAPEENTNLLIYTPKPDEIV